LVDVASARPDRIVPIKRVVDAGLPVGVLVKPNWESAIARSIPEECVDFLVQGGKIAMFLNMGGMSEHVIKAADDRGLRIFGSSANISGTGNSFVLDEVPAAILDSTDLICDAGKCKYAGPERMATTIVELETGKLARAGIRYAEIEARLAGRAA
jgi:hypothetical protein